MVQISATHTFGKKVKKHVTSMKRRVVIDVLFRALLCLVCIEVFEIVALIETEDTLPIIGIDYKKTASCLVGFAFLLRTSE